jgi:phosphatidylglycerophosphatase A
MRNKANKNQENHSYQPIGRYSPTNLAATVMGIGYIKFAPGTFGSIIGLLDFAISIHLIQKLNFVYVPFIFLTSYFFINRYCEITKKHDPKEVVLDEYAGQYFACFIAYYILSFTNPATVKLYDGFILNIFVVITRFVFFRFFDISKLSLVGYYDRKDDSFSVLMDDIVAGVFAGILTAAIFSLI